jgi:hypothetical protein
VRVEGTKEMGRILRESKTNDFDGVATGDKSWFQHTTASSKMFSRSRADFIPRTWEIISGKNTMITMFFTAKKLTVFDVLPRGSTFNQLYFINDMFPVLK